MTRRRWIAVAVAVGLLALAAGVALQWTVTKRSQTIDELLHFQMKDLDGRPVSLTKWAGSPLVVNFWATWCDPCREEVPTLVEAQRRLGKGVQIVGIGIDSAAKMRQFAESYGINYPITVAGPDVIEVTRRVGNAPGGLPYTVAIDGEGRVRGSHLGGMRADQLNALIRAITPSASR